MAMSEEQKALAFATLLPGAVGVVSSAVIYNDSTILDWFQSLKKPSYWCAEKRTKKQEFGLVTTLNFLAGMPLVYATYKVWTQRGGFGNVDSGRALTTYGINSVLGLVHILILKKKSLKGTLVSCLAIFANSCAMHYFYHKVDKKLGYLAIPFNLLLALHTLNLYNVWNLNKTEQTKK